MTHSMHVHNSLHTFLVLHCVMYILLADLVCDVELEKGVFNCWQYGPTHWLKFNSEFQKENLS